MSNEFDIKQNDTAPAISTTLKQDGTAVVLTGHTVRFHMKEEETGVLKVDAAAVPDPDQVENPGLVSYVWQAGDTDTVGRYLAEWEVAFSTGGKTTFPSNGYNVVNILEELD